MRMLVVLVTFCLSSISLVAQERPDFTGQWILASSPSATTATELTVELSDSFLPRYAPTNQPPQEFVNVKRLFGNRHMEAFGIVVSASTLSPVGTDRTDAFLVFEGQTLIMQMPIRRDPANQPVLRREIWSLTPEGLLRITTTDRLTNGEPATSEAEYRRAAK